MICRTASLLLIALTPAALADEPATGGQLSLDHAVIEQGGGAVLLPAPNANGTNHATAPLSVGAQQPADVPIANTSAEAGTAVTSSSEIPPPQAAQASSSDSARLMRRSATSALAMEEGLDAELQSNATRPSLASDAATTAVSAMALVVGLFLVCAWVFKRSMPKSSRLLPREAAEILGRCPLGNKQFAHLLHVGNKVILVHVTPNGAETLVEVDDPNEVVRILGVCAAASPGSTSKEFDAIFHQFAKEPTPKGFLGEEAANYTGSTSPLPQGSKRGLRG